jgi:hypothetical protein
MTILVIGDSTAFGAELSDLPGTRDGFGYYGNDYVDLNGNQQTTKPSQLAWPALLGQQLNVDVDNLSIIGGSNERMYRLAVEQTSEKSYGLVICAWTGMGRLDLQYNGIDIAVASQCYFEFDWIKTYTAQHYNLLADTKKWLIHLITLQSYFKQRKQPYLFVRSQSSDNFSELVSKLVYLSGQIDTNNCMYWHTDMYANTKDYPRGSQGHMLEQSHQIIAQELGRLIRDKSLI